MSRVLPPEKKISPANYALGFIVVCMVIYICKIASAVTIPFVVAVFIWYLINAIARFLGLLHFKSGYVLPRLLRFTIAVVLLLGLTTLIFELVHQNIDSVIREAPKFQTSFARIVDEASVMLKLDHAPSFQDMKTEIFSKYIDIGAMIRLFAAMLTDMAGKVIIVIFFVGFLLYEQRFFDHKIKWIIRDKGTEARVRSVLKAIDIKIQKYIGVKALVSFLDSSITFGILSSFHIDFAGFWGVMAFFLHFIPYAGSFVALTMPVLIALIQFGDLTTCLMVFGSLALSHAVLGHLVDPYLMGNNLNLSPIFIITNLAAWGLIWGVPGMFLAIPILAIVTITLAQFEQTRPLAIMVSKTGVIDKA